MPEVTTAEAAQVGHSKVGASSYYRWKACPGSVKLSQGIKSVDSEYAKEGTLAHLIFAFYLSRRRWPKHDELQKLFSESGYFLTGEEYAEMKEHLQIAVDAVLNDFKFFADLGETHEEILIEHRFNLECVYPGAFGTADAVLIFPVQKKIIVYDLKYGAGIPVEVQDSEGKNKQLKYYGLGALLSLSNSDIDEIELVILQPRCFHPEGPIRRASLTAMELLEFSGELHRDCEATADPKAPLRAGEHCRFCPANGICPQLNKSAMEAAKSAFLPVAIEPTKQSHIKADELRKALEVIPQLEAFIEGVRSLAYNEAMAGRCPKGFKLVKKRAHRKWLEYVTPELLQKDLGLDEKHILEEPKLKSPAQVEKVLTKHGKEELQKYVSQESTGLTLVPDLDKREAIETGAKAAFDAVPIDFVEVDGEELKLLETVYV